MHVGRRRVARALAGAALGLGAPHARAPNAWAQDATALGVAPTMLVGGPAGGRLDRLAELVASALARGFPPGTQVRRQASGGDDGVTAANQFDTRTEPDGQTSALLPGDSAFAWLAADPRAHFDPGRWVPVLSAVTSAVVISRVPAREVLAGARLRVAAAGPPTPDLAALLALELLGVAAVPQFGPRDADADDAALAAGAVDALMLRGDRIADRVARLAASGAVPLFVLGLPDEAGEWRRDPAFAATPTLVELLRPHGDPANRDLFGAWRVAAVAAQLDFALVLPQLAPAAAVSVWRRAAAAGTPDLQAALGDGVHPIAAPSPNLPTISADAAALLELRRWLSSRYNWQPA